jgi:hypothetical protein
MERSPVNQTGSVIVERRSQKGTGLSSWWIFWLPILIGLIVGIWLAFSPLFDFTPPIQNRLITDVSSMFPGPSITPTKGREYVGLTSSKTATPTPRPSSSNDVAPAPPPVSSVDECAVFEGVQILKTVLMRMKECNPSLTFYYKMDREIPGLADPSAGDWEYWVTVGGYEGYCYLDASFTDRLYCRADLSAGDAFTLRQFELFASGCDAPISSQKLTIPELEGCSAPAPQPDQSGCSSGDIVPGIGTEADCVPYFPQGYIWDWVDAYQYCMCP